MIQKRQIKKLKTKFNNRTLGQRYPEFQKCILISTKGETIIDYKNQNSLNELNNSIMDYYFGIREFRLPLTQMIPALGCRLNYIEWVKQQVDLHNFKIDQIYDVGTGYSGIFIFLAYRLYGWQGIGVDISASAINHAQNIATKNKIPCQFKQGSLFDFLQDGMVVVCNPPFYDEGESRIFNRTIDNNETYSQGGEVKFIQEMIEKSDKQCFYTTMLGRKSSLKYFESIYQIVELHQGNNVRYSMCWEKIQSPKQPTVPIN